MPHNHFQRKTTVPGQSPAYFRALATSIFLFLLLQYLPLIAQPGLPWRAETVAPGIVWKNLHADSLYGHPQHLNVLEVEARRQRAGIAFCTDTLIRSSHLAEAAQAVAAVNAGFFDTKAGGSVTFLKVDGSVVNFSRPKHIEDKSEILRGAVVIHKNGKMRIEAAGPDSMYLAKKYYSVLLTGPLLIENGQPVTLADRAFNTNRHPRTCACITTDKRLLLLTVDGRTASSHGMSLPELTTLLQSFGCRDAVNLDGGGSTTMWIRGKPDGGIVNMPCDNRLFDPAGERSVANAIILRPHRRRE